MLARSFAVGLLVLSRIAAAQLLADDFESGDLDAGWVFDNSVSGITLSVVAAGAHRGHFGARVVDTETVTNQTFGTFVRRSFAPTGPDSYSRVWVRLSSWSGSGGMNFYSLTAPRGSNWGNYVDLVFQSSGQLDFVVQTSLDTGTSMGYLEQGTVDAMTDGGWHLYETETHGVGTDAGSSAVYFDGVLAATLSPFTLLTDGSPFVRIGEIYSHSGGGFTGVIDYDDVRVDGAPLGGALAVSAPAMAKERDCLSVTVSMVAHTRLADGGNPGAVKATYPIALALGGLTAYSDGSCTQQISPTLAQGASSVVFHVIALPATSMTIDVSHADTSPDFFPGSAQVALGPADGGAGGGSGAGGGGGTVGERSYYALGCSEVPGGLGAWLAVVALATRVRRRVTEACGRC